MSKRGWWKMNAATGLQSQSGSDMEILRPGVAVTECTDVPHVIYQTWETHDMSARMRAAVATVIAANPGFAHRIFDAAERRAFLAEHFTDAVVAAYDALIPGAYKADLWRYCLLHLWGGYYLDIKFEPVDGWSLASLTEPTYVLDNAKTFAGVSHGVYNAFLMARPGCPHMRAAIVEVVKNVQNRFIGEISLDITGPSIFGKIIARDACKLYWDLSRVVTLDRYTPLLRVYDGYRDDCAAAGIVHFSKMWPLSVYVDQTPARTEEAVCRIVEAQNRVSDRVITMHEG